MVAEAITRTITPQSQQYSVTRSPDRFPITHTATIEQGRVIITTECYAMMLKNVVRLEFALDDPDDFYAEVVSPDCHSQLVHVVLAEAVQELLKEWRLRHAGALAQESDFPHAWLFRDAAHRLQAYAEGWRQGVLDEMEGE